MSMTTHVKKGIFLKPMDICLIVLFCTRISSHTLLVLFQNSDLVFTDLSAGVTLIIFTVMSSIIGRLSTKTHHPL